MLEAFIVGVTIVSGVVCIVYTAYDIRSTRRKRDLELAILNRTETIIEVVSDLPETTPTEGAQ